MPRVDVDSYVDSYVVIPARLKSTRLPRKLLLKETGKSLLQHTYEAACRARRPAGVLVAADCEEIADEVRHFGGQVILTNPAAPSGTDRVAEAAAQLGAKIVVNLQGDEPEVEADAIDHCIQLLHQHPHVPVATLATPIRRHEVLTDPACVKVVFDDRGQALYFSRSPIPFVRDGQWTRALAAEPPSFFLHVGMYAYRRDFLMQLAQLPPSRLESWECLEQLRVLAAGHSIQVGVVAGAAVGIDTPADYQAFLDRQQRRAA